MGIFAKFWLFLQCPRTKLGHVRSKFRIFLFCPNTTLNITDRPLFFPQGGIVIGKKIVCMRKNAEINCLPKRCIWRKIICRDHLCYARFGELKKKVVCTAGLEEKSLQVLNRWWKKLSASQKSLYPPPPAKNNGPSLRKSHKSSSGKALYFRSYQLSAKNITEVENTPHCF